MNKESVSEEFPRRSSFLIGKRQIVSFAPCCQLLDAQGKVKISSKIKTGLGNVLVNFWEMGSVLLGLEFGMFELKTIN
jgi:hypothetical protein